MCRFFWCNSSHPLLCHVWNPFSWQFALPATANEAMNSTGHKSFLFQDILHIIDWEGYSIDCCLSAQCDISLDKNFLLEVAEGCFPGVTERNKLALKLSCTRVTLIQTWYRNSEVICFCNSICSIHKVNIYNNIFQIDIYLAVFWNGMESQLWVPVIILHWWECACLSFQA